MCNSNNEDATHIILCQDPIISLLKIKLIKALKVWMIYIYMEPEVKDLFSWEFPPGGPRNFL